MTPKNENDILEIETNEVLDADAEETKTLEDELFADALEMNVTYQNEDFDETSVEPFEVSEEQLVTLKNGTQCLFEIPTLRSEERADALRITTTIVSNRKINGKNPYTEKTKHVKADVRYFIENAKELRGFTWFDETQPRTVNAQEIVTPDPDGIKAKDITYAKLLSIKYQRAFAQRLYGGAFELKKDETPDGKKIVRMGGKQLTVVKHIIGVESNADGSLTDPEHIVFYHFKEPTEKEFEQWDGVSGGYKLPLDKGGFQQTHSLYTKRVVEMFDKLIVKVEGATYNGQPFDVKNKAHELPFSIRRNAIVIAFGEWISDVGNE
jgi:hypothetical protein